MRGTRVTTGTEDMRGTRATTGTKGIIGTYREYRGVRGYRLVEHTLESLYSEEKGFCAA